MATTKEKKVLIVEDDSVLGSMYKIKFETNGFSVTVATNGADGLEVARKSSFDIILLDIIMPQLDGFSVLAELKDDAKTKEVPVIKGNGGCRLYSQIKLDSDPG